MLDTEIAGPPKARMRGLPIAVTWAAIAVATPVVVAFLKRTMAIDLAYQIRAGSIMLDTHRLLNVDAFTFTVGGRPWLNQQWGAEVLLASLYRLGGWGGIAVARGVLVGATLWLIYLACRAVGATPRAAASLTLAGWAVGIDILPELRPQAFAFVLFSVCLWAVASRRAHPARIWLVPVSTVLWANLHGSFPLAVVLLAFAFAEDIRADRSAVRHEALAIVLSLAATLANPYGAHVWSYVVDVATHPVVSGLVNEWESPTLHSWSGLFFFASLLAVGAVFARRSQSVRWVLLLEMGVFALLGLLAIRGVVWWGLFMPVGLAALDGGRIAEVPESRSPMNAIILAGLAVLLVVTLPIGRGSDPASGGPAVLSVAPETLVASARDAVPTGSHAFVSQLFASWSEFSAPDLPVAVDPRIEIFPTSVWDDYFTVSLGREGWQQVLDRWDVRVLVLEKGQAEGLLKVIAGSPQWRLLTENEEGFAYVRT